MKSKILLILATIFLFSGTSVSACDLYYDDDHIPAQYSGSLLVVNHQYVAATARDGWDCFIFWPASDTTQTMTQPYYDFNVEYGNPAISVFIAGSSEGIQCVIDGHNYPYNDIAAQKSFWVELKVPESCFSAYD